MNEMRISVVNHIFRMFSFIDIENVYSTLPSRKEKPINKDILVEKNCFSLFRPHKHGQNDKKFYILFDNGGVFFFCFNSTSKSHCSLFS